MAKTTLTPEDLKRVAANIDTKFSIALANLERAEEDQAANFGTFRFTVLAAKAGDLRLPSRMIAANDSLLTIEFAEDKTGIEVAISADGLRRVRQLRNREARLVSDNGLVDYTFRFSVRGDAKFRLSNDFSVKNALIEGFAVEYTS